MQPLADERALIERAKKRDKEAITSLYETYAQVIFRYIAFRVDSETTAEDLTADVFLRMIRSLPNFVHTDIPFRAWLFRIAANRITDYYREKKPLKSETLLENYRSDEIEPLAQLVREEQRSHVRSALQALPEDFQNVIILRFVRDLSHAEVAAIINKSEGAIRVMQHRALKALAMELKRREITRGENE